MQMALAKSMSEKIDDADMQRSWSKVKSGEKRKPRQLSEVQTSIPALPIGNPPPCHAPSALGKLTHAQRQAFKRMALHPDEVLNLAKLKCISDTADKLVAVGLAERVGLGWRCADGGCRRSRMSSLGSSFITWRPSAFCTWVW